jgi:microcystin-dependent protein
MYQIQQYQALFSLIGNVYGGDAKTTFRVPDLRGRVPVGLGTAAGSVHAWTLGGANGADMVSLNNTNYLPPHNHNLQIPAAPSTTGVAADGAALGPVAPNQFFSGPISDANTTFSPLALGSAYGPGTAHENRQPYLVLNACIAWDGDYPYLND